MATPIKVTHDPASAVGPTPGTRFTEQYARLVARDTYFWAWTLSNVYNRRRGFAQLKEPDKPFFCWFNSTRMHIFTHLKHQL